MVKVASSPPSVDATWRKLLGMIPGYDSFAQAGDCWFDKDAAQLALDFFPECLTYIEGDKAGQPFAIEPWQAAIVTCLFGWKRKNTKGKVVRRYREAFILIPRKQGKSTFAAGLCLLCLFCDGEAGSQIYCAAAESKQAGLVFRHARGMVEAEPELASRCKVYGGAGHLSIVLNADQASSIKVLSSDAFSKHGYNPQLAVIDELHAHPSRDLVDVLQSGMGARSQPLTVFITTADFQRESICNEKHAYARKVRDGIIPDLQFLPVIYEALATEDWTDPKVWARVNPNLGVSVEEEFLAAECAKAKEIPAYENTFKRMYLNIQTEQDVRAMPMEQWDKCGQAPIDPDSLKGRECYLGLDLANTTDIAAAVLLFPDGEGGYEVLPYFWVPQEGARLRERRDRVPYELWIKQGLIEATEGNSIDYDIIRKRINELSERHDIKEVAADRWNATQIITQLTGDGLKVLGFGQGYRDMTAPTKELFRLVADGKLHHGGNPVLRWMASNLATEEDAAGNLKPSKKKSTEKIDGLVAIIMALGRAILTEVDWYTPGSLRG